MSRRCNAGAPHCPARCPAPTMKFICLAWPYCYGLEPCGGRMRLHAGAPSLYHAPHSLSYITHLGGAGRHARRRVIGLGLVDKHCHLV